MNLLDPQDDNPNSYFPGGRMFSYEGFSVEAFVTSFQRWKSFVQEIDKGLEVPRDLYTGYRIRRIVAWTSLCQAFSDTPELDVYAMQEAIHACALNSKTGVAKDGSETSYWNSHFRHEETNQDPTLHEFLELLFWWVWEEHDEADQPLEPYTTMAEQWAQYVMGHANGVMRGYYPDEADYRE